MNNTRKKKIQAACGRNLIVARPCRKCQDATVITAVAGGKCAPSRTASGVFQMLQRKLGHTASGQMLLPQKDVPGKRFSSNAWKAIYSLGREVETLNLAVGGKK